MVKILARSFNIFNLQVAHVPPIIPLLAHVLNYGPFESLWNLAAGKRHPPYEWIIRIFSTHFKVFLLYVFCLETV